MFLYFLGLDVLYVTCFGQIPPQKYFVCIFCFFEYIEVHMVLTNLKYMSRERLSDVYCCSCNLLVSDHYRNNRPFIQILLTLHLPSQVLSAHA